MTRVLEARSGGSEARRAMAPGGGLRLVLLVAAGLLLQVAVLYGAATAARACVAWMLSDPGRPWAPRWWDPGLLAGLAAVVALAFALATWIKARSLSGGGLEVALQLGAEIAGAGEAARERDSLIRVVREGAVALGLPSPPVAMLREQPGVGVAVVGFEPGDAVLLLTDGAAASLAAAELRAVILHQLLQARGGGMGRRLRAVAPIYGLQALGLGGRSLVGGSARALAPRGNGVGPGVFKVLLAFGGLLAWLLGQPGFLLGERVKRILVRADTRAADRAAARFLGGSESLRAALRRIDGHPASAMVRVEGICGFDHCFFDDPAPGRGPGRGPQPAPRTRIAWLDAAGAEDEAESAGGAGPALASAGRRLDGIPGAVLGALGSAHDALALVFALLLDRDPALRAGQMERIRALLPPGIAEGAERLHPHLVDLSDGARLPLVSLLAPELRGLAPGQHARALEALRGVAAADRKISLFEYAVQRMVRAALRSGSGRPSRPGRVLRIRDLHDDLAVLLSAVARVGQREEPEIRAAFEAGAARLPRTSGAGVALRSAEQATLGAVDRALDRIERGSAPLRRAALEACTACIRHDRVITDREAELVRAVGAALDLPVPLG